MYREIKFRAWNPDPKHPYPMVKNPLHRCDASDVLENRSIYKDWILMQFTGLLDKNGVEIYEGDIVKNNKYGGNSEIIWKQGQGSNVGIVKGIFGEESDLTGFISEIGSFEFKGIGHPTKAHYIGEFEVIGNIYQNPELLK
jgi:uncharacterized phage protein (TIGR01671 family)